MLEEKILKTSERAWMDNPWFGGISQDELLKIHQKDVAPHLGGKKIHNFLSEVANKSDFFEKFEQLLTFKETVPLGRQEKISFFRSLILCPSALVVFEEVNNNKFVEAMDFVGYPSYQPWSLYSYRAAALLSVVLPMQDYNLEQSHQILQEVFGFIDAPMFNVVRAHLRMSWYDKAGVAALM